MTAGMERTESARGSGRRRTEGRAPLARMARPARRKGPGQVLVEMLLVLPIFFTIIFTIMELGNVAFQVILFNHALFETVRYGSMTVTPSVGGSPNISVNDLDEFLSKKILATAHVVSARADPAPFDDRQAGVRNNDLVVTATYPIPLIFPFSNFILSKPPGSGHREITLTQRMPIERPLDK